MIELDLPAPFKPTTKDVVDFFGNCGLVGEEDNAILLTLAATSKKAVGVESTSGAVKTVLLDICELLLPAKSIYKLGMTSNTATTSDAAKKIEYKINNPNYNFNDPYPAGSYVVDVGTEEVAAWEYDNPEDPGSDDNWLDYLMYHEVTNNIITADECLEPIEMNFYLQGTLDVINIIIDQKQLEYPEDNIEFVYLSLNGQMASFPGIISYYHSGEITYGKRVLRIPPTE